MQTAPFIPRALPLIPLAIAWTLLACSGEQTGASTVAAPNGGTASGSPSAAASTAGAADSAGSAATGGDASSAQGQGGSSAGNANAGGSSGASTAASGGASEVGGAHASGGTQASGGAASPDVTGGHDQPWAVCPQPGELGPPPCEHFAGGELPFSGKLPQCPYDAQPRTLAYEDYTCLDHCGCWFNGEAKCGSYLGTPWEGQKHVAPSTKPVFETPGECLKACELMTDEERGKFYYRTNNNDFHCPDAVPWNLCPSPADEACP